jgi:hypothetical protein
LLSIGDGDGTVVIRLTPDAAVVAEELKLEFGDVVSITVGFKPFPSPVNGYESIPLSFTESGELTLALDIGCETDRATIACGESVTGQLALTNSGVDAIYFTASAATGWLCEPGTLNVIGGHGGAVAAGSRTIALDAGGIARLNFITGTASCVSDGRYTVAPGMYEVGCAIVCAERNRRRARSPIGSQLLYYGYRC